MPVLATHAGLVAGRPGDPALKANPNRDTTAGAAFLDIRALSRAQGRNVAEPLDLYLLEGFLARPAVSSHRSHLALNGGALLAAYGTRRPTRDVDRSPPTPHVQTDGVLALIGDIAALPRDDGLIFHTTAATAGVIRDDDEYSRIRVALTAALGRARLAFTSTSTSATLSGPLNASRAARRHSQHDTTSDAGRRHHDTRGQQRIIAPPAV